MEAPRDASPRRGCSDPFNQIPQDSRRDRLVVKSEIRQDAGYLDGALERRLAGGALLGEPRRLRQAARLRNDRRLPFAPSFGQRCDGMAKLLAGSGS